MINLTKIYSYTQDIVKADKSLNINQFTYGDIYEKLNVKENKYPTLHYSLNNVTQNNNTVTYNFNIFYVDRLLENNKNETGIIDDSYMTIQRVINTFSDGVDDAGENVSIKVSNNFEFFKEDFADRCAGCYVNVQFEVLNYVGRCHDVDVPVYPVVDLQTFTIKITENGTYEYVSEDGTAWNKLEITVDSEVKPELIDEKIEEHNVSTTSHPDIRENIADLEVSLSGKEDVGVAENLLNSHNIDVTAHNDIRTELSNKVEQVDGKGLSTNDYTDDEKTKLEGIDENANNYVLPTDVVQDADYNHTDNNLTDALITEWNGKQDTISVGTGLSMENNVISFTGTTEGVTKEYVDEQDDILRDSKEPRLIKVSSTDVAPIIHIEDNREYSLTGVLTSLTINKAPLFDDDSFAVIKFNTPATLPENFITVDASLIGFPTVEGGNHYIITFMGNYVNAKSYTIGG